MHELNAEDTATVDLVREKMEGTFTQEQADYRLVLRDFIQKEVVDKYAEWCAAGLVPRDLYTQLGSIGTPGIPIPAEYGGGGDDDFRYSVVLSEEMARAGVMLGTMRTHLDVVLPYFLGLADEQQRDRWFSGLALGDLFCALALTEPGTGSDLAGIRTTAVRDGDDYVLTGAKTFITGGHHADLVIVLARTSSEDDRRAGLTLLVVENGMSGFHRGRLLQKIGTHVMDTAELVFEDVRVPVANRLGEEGKAFGYLGRNLAKERLTIAVGAVAQSRKALELTIDYVKNRTVFGKPLSSMQNTKFELGAMAAELDAAQALVDRSVDKVVAGRLSGVDAAKTKLFCTEFQGRVMDRCLQLHGGYGYMVEQPISQLYVDARVTRIYGGTSEVMKSIIGKSLVG